MSKHGLAIVVSGAGKTTSIAAMLHHRNATQSGHILTIEDPIERNHPDLKSIVNQREIGGAGSDRIMATFNTLQGSPCPTLSP